MTASALRAVVVDDHRLMAHALALALGLEGISCLVADLSDRDDLVRSVTEAPPDLVLLDLDLGGAVGDGATLVPAFVAAGCRVLVVSAATDRDQLCRALELGAVGVVAKDAPFPHLLETAVAVAHGQQVLAPTERERMLGEVRAEREHRARLLGPFERLSSREAQVLRALADGSAVASIAGAWWVSEATVRTQVRAILTKLGVSSQLEAVAAAHRSGWLRA